MYIGGHRQDTEPTTPPMKILHFMNEIPYAFPAALAERMDQREDVDVIVASFYNDIGDEVREGPLKVVVLGATGRFDMSAYRQLRRLIIDRGIDVVHTHPNMTGAMARIVTATTDAAVVDTRHNDHCHFEWYRRIPIIPAGAETDCFISNSQNTRESFSSIENLLLRLGGGRHEVVHNGINPSRVNDLPAEPRALPGGPRIVCVARYVPQKNHETLVRAMMHVRECIPDASLILVGEGPRFDQIASLVTQLNLNDAVVQTGYLAHRAQVFSVVDNADVFAISSWYEGFCIAAVEAMLTGTPVIASDIDVFREVVGEAGLFADPTDPAAFADQIVTLLQDDTKRKRLGKMAAERVRSTFTLDQTVEGYVHLYRTLVNEE